MKPAYSRRIYSYETPYSYKDFKYVLSRMFEEVEAPTALDRQRKQRLDNDVMETFSEEYQASDQEQGQIKLYEGRAKRKAIDMDYYRENSGESSFSEGLGETANGQVRQFRMRLALRPHAQSPNIDFECSFLETQEGVNYIFIFCDNFVTDWLKAILTGTLITGLRAADFLYEIESGDINFSEAYEAVQSNTSEDMILHQGDAELYFRINSRKKLVEQQGTDFEELIELKQYMQRISNGIERFKFTTLGFKVLLENEDEGEYDSSVYYLYYQESKKSLRLFADSYEVGGQKMAAEIMTDFLEV